MVLTVILLFSTSSTLKAQIPGTGPFTIINNTSCKMELRWDVRDGTCGSVCLGSVGTIVIAGPGNFVITAAMIAGSPCAFPANCDVIVTILGPPTNHFPSSYTYGSNTLPFSVTENDCTNSSYIYTFTSSTTDITIW